ncbi:hypothetical protein B0T19DRAFT_440404 [Cercophora scortea]|uniref:Uncharacterized protein n=1 Tax=Cercophora scortea TaxID=314031 RepID=A0AAE0IYM5_9PEZI|nr:hypothetical protein B0T19DRAFT_440404 [Cercophora scortea]
MDVDMDVVDVDMAGVGVVHPSPPPVPPVKPSSSSAPSSSSSSSSAVVAAAAAQPQTQTQTQKGPRACHRLDKPCSSQTPAPPRKRKEPKPTRVSELEKKLEDLTARIESVQHQTATPTPTPPESGSDVNNHHQHHSNADADRGISVGVTPQKPWPSHTPGRRPGEGRWYPMAHLFPAESPQPSTSSGKQPSSTLDSARLSPPVKKRQTSPPLAAAAADLPPHRQHLSPVPASTSTPASVSVLTAPPNTTSGAPPPPPPPPQLWPEEDEAASLLAEYTTHLSHLFPFAVVPPRMTSFELRQRKPFFWKAIMMEACHLDGARQMALGDELLREIAEAAITKPQKSLDLLQGLQILISWYHYNLNSFQMTNLLFLARSICSSLGFTESQSATMQREQTSDSLEQMRAFAGTYYLVTVTFTTNKKPDALMNTSYLEACCFVLEREMEYDTDEILVWLVRAQQLAQAISWRLALCSNPDIQPNSSPLPMVIKGFQEQLRTFRNSLPHHLRDNASLVGHLHVAEILLYEIGLQSPSTFSLAEQADFLRACLCATKSFFDNRFAQEIQEHPRFICMSSFDFIYAFLTALKLITFQAPWWDPGLVRTSLCFDQFLDRQVRDMEFMAERRRRRRRRGYGDHVGVGGVSPPDAGGGMDEAEAEGDIEAHDPFFKLAKKMRQLGDIMRGECDDVYKNNLVQAVDTAPMTLTDATQALMQDLEDDSSLWQQLAIDWNAFNTLFLPPPGH